MTVVKMEVYGLFAWEALALDQGRKEGSRNRLERWMMSFFPLPFLFLLLLSFCLVQILSPSQGKKRG